MGVTSAALKQNNCRILQQPVLHLGLADQKLTKLSLSRALLPGTHWRPPDSSAKWEFCEGSQCNTKTKQDMTLQLGVTWAKFPCSHQGAGVFKPPWKVILDAQILLWNKSCVQAPGFKAAKALYSKHISIPSTPVRNPTYCTTTTVPTAPLKASTISVFENLPVQTHFEMPEPGTSWKGWLDCLQCSLQAVALTHWTQKAPPFLQHMR